MKDFKKGKGGVNMIRLAFRKITVAAILRKEFVEEQEEIQGDHLGGSCTIPCTYIVSPQKIRLIIINKYKPEWHLTLP